MSVTCSASASLGVLCLLSIGCGSPHPPSIEFTRVPPAGQGSPDIVHAIEGRVTGARRGQRVVLFARSGVWWVQPVAERPFTDLDANSKWKNTTHPGSAYAALLVDPGYQPPLTVNALPAKGGPVKAVVAVEGPSLPQSPPKKLHFSGYDWLIRETPGTPGGTRNLYDAANAWVDPKGFLHLRIAGDPNRWTSAEISLPRSLGYGTYRFVTSDISQLPPAVVLSISTWDDSGPYQEMDIEIGRWGEAAGKNAQYVVQPYYVPANVVRFLAPEGPLASSFDWQPGRVAFRTVRGRAVRENAEAVSTHVFTSGVPSPGSETVRINLYVFQSRGVPMNRGVEVVLEKFEYLP